MADFRSLAIEGDGDVAKRNAVNEQVVRAYVSRLKASGLSREIFDTIIREMKSEKSLQLLELSEIAVRYAGVRRPSSISSAYSAITKRFVQLSRAAAKADIAARSRPL